MLQCVGVVGGREEERELVTHTEVVPEQGQTTETGGWLTGNSDPGQAECICGYHTGSSGL